MAEQGPPAVVVKAGVARIKSEYLLPDHVRELNTKFVAVKDKRSHSDEEGDQASDGFSKKRMKLKGQNKCRPKQKRPPSGTKLCFALGLRGSCLYGDNCRYSHDIDSYLSHKPSDIGKTCYLYETFGKCSYSLSCRFGAGHIENGKNLVNKLLWDTFRDRKLTQNALPNGLKNALRKHRFDFGKSETVLKSLAQRKQDPVGDGNKLNSEKVVNTVIVSPHDKDVVNSTSHDDMATTTSGLIKIEPSLVVTTENSQDQVVSLDKPSLETKGDKDSVTMTKFPDMDGDTIKLKPSERKKIDFQNKLYLAPLTTVGNLPFRRICKEFGADITCGEMAMAANLLKGSHSEWALLRRHHTEDIFGVQLCGAHADVMTRCCQMLNENIEVDFIDINMGCPLDFVCQKGAGSGLMNRMKKLDEIIYSVTSVIDVPLTLKMRTGISSNDNLANKIIDKIHSWGDRVELITLHGRSKEQRYTKNANWDYINYCAELSKPISFFGNGDILSFEDYNACMNNTNISGAMIARGAIIKPWIFQEIKEQRHMDISSTERFDILKKYVNYGLEHWGSDTEGVENTRRFLLEWLSFLYRYIPVGLLEHVPQKVNERPPLYQGRNDLETLMASPSCADWVKISEMLLGPVPEHFIFLPKHKANAYQ